MSSITIENTVYGARVNADSVKLKDVTNTYGIRRIVDGVTVVPPTGPIAPASLGTYTFDTTTLTAGDYQGVWEIITGADTDYEPVFFSLDSPVLTTPGPRLLEIEQELAARCGPYYEEVCGTGCQTTVAYIPTLKSTVDYGGYEDLYLLRRGRLVDGSAVVPFTADDRIRIVTAYSGADGSLTIERPWALAPQLNEVIELHYLHPARELRVSVLAGLRRCFFEDRVTISTSGAAAERSLTAAAAWLTDESAVRDVQFSYQNTVYLPFSLREWRTLRNGNGVFLQARPDPYPNSLLVTLLRPAHTLVNGQASLVGPDDDDDTVAVPLEYAVAAAHVECWKRFARRLQPAAQTGLHPAQKVVAETFTLESLARVKRTPEKLQLRQPTEIGKWQ